VAKRPRLGAAVIVLGVFAAALFYGDAIITPAISVLSAIEGVAVAAPSLAHWVIPITIGILVALFAAFTPLVRRRSDDELSSEFAAVLLIAPTHFIYDEFLLLDSISALEVTLALEVSL